MIVGVLRPNFFLPATLFQQLSGAAFIGMLALGMVFVVVIRDIDLSVGWMFNFSAVIAAKAMVAGVDPWIAAGIGIAFGGLLGLINGVLAVSLRIPVIIITLGTLSAYRGLTLVVNESRAVVPPDKSSSFFALFDVKVFGLIPMRRRRCSSSWPSSCTCCSTGPASGTGSRRWAATPTRPGSAASRSTARGSWCWC